MRAAHEVVQLGERLDAARIRRPTNANVSRRWAELEVGVGEVELVQHVVAQRDRVGEVLELERVLAHRRGRGARDSAPSAITISS